MFNHSALRALVLASLTIVPASLATAASITVSGFGITVSVDCADLTISGGMTCEELCTEIDDSWFTSCTYNSNGSVQITTYTDHEAYPMELSDAVVEMGEGGTGVVNVIADDATLVLAAESTGLTLVAETARGDRLGSWEAPFEARLSAVDGLVLSLEATADSKMTFTELLDLESRE